MISREESDKRAKEALKKTIPLLEEVRDGKIEDLESQAMKIHTMFMLDMLINSLRTEEKK